MAASHFILLILFKILYLVVQYIHMQQQVEPPFEKRNAQYFEQKAKQAHGKEKLLVALEMSKYLSAAREQGLSFEELEKAGFKFATVPDIKN
jgi:hypothetical protein